MTIGHGPEHAVLTAFARGVLGRAYEAGVADNILGTLTVLASETDRKRLVATLRALNTRSGALFLTGSAVPVSWRTPTEVEALLQKWKVSRLPVQRQLAGILISASVANLYGHPTREWARIGYPGPLGSPPDVPPRFEPTRIDRDEHISCDVVVVGSGPGGQTVAAHLAAAGLDVLVLEKGSYVPERAMHHFEFQSHREMYLYGATLNTLDGGVRVIAGSTLGGGAVVNYTISFDPTEATRRQWARISGIESFANGEFEESLHEAAAKLNVNKDSSALNPRERPMEEGLKALGWHVDQMPRAVAGCTQDEQCGYCGFGCRHGAKQGARAYLEGAVASGARVFTDVDVRKVTISDGRATGVAGTSGDHRLIVDARKAVVVAGGAIETPALLLRSGLRGDVGKHLHLHPGVGVWALMEDETRPWEGVQMSRYSDEIRDWEDGYGPLYESVPMHPGTFSTAAPWISADDHYDQMSRYPRTALIAALPRDRTEGRVTIDKHGAPRLDYTINRVDERVLVGASIRAAKIFEAAGATEIRSPHSQKVTYRPSEAGAHERWADEVRKLGIKPHNALAGSFHQMGSVRMGVDPTTSAVGPDNQSHELNGLYVTDSSNFPDASGVNPMLAVFGIANIAGKKLAEKLS